MKKIVIITLCLIAVGFAAYFVISGNNNQIVDNPEEADTQSLNESDSNSKESITKDEKNDVTLSSDGEIIENNENNGTNSIDVATKDKEDEELEDKSLEDKNEDVVESNNDEGSSKDDEFYDTSTRDPFAEEQHKSDVPLVLIDKDGNEMEPETVYWDEESGRGTLDPNGYIPEGLPPGAVFVAEITPEEEARLREEFGVGD